ncbi:MAG: hypothetical protein O2960_03180 [Verrucomicrobia bacterium]|nr:hypothetical protein [Verrucomicrobiota bacterium]
MKPREIPKNCFGSRLRRCLRWIRVLLLLLFLAISGVCLYLNQAGLPESLTTRLESALRKRGLDIQLGLVRFRGFRTFAADNIRFRSSSDGNPINAQLQEGVVRVAWSSLFRFKLAPEEFSFGNGAIELPFLDRGKGSTDASIRDIELKIRFLPEDRWEMADFRGTLFNIQVQASGLIDHASAIGMPGRTESGIGTAVELERRFRDWIDWVRDCEFADTSLLTVKFREDILNAARSEATVKLRFPVVNASWGSLTDVQGDVRVSPKAGDPEVAELSANLRCGALVSKFARLHELTFQANASGSITPILLNRIDWVLDVTKASWENGSAEAAHASGTTSRSSSADSKAATHLSLDVETIDAGWFGARKGRLDAELFHSRTNGPAVTGDWHWVAAQMVSGPVQSDGVELSGRVSWPADSRGNSEIAADQMFRRALNSTRFTWAGKISHARAGDLDLGNVDWSGGWYGPELTTDLAHFEATECLFRASVTIDTLSREVALEFESRIDVHRISDLLPIGARDSLQQLAWETPPVVIARARFAIPANEDLEPFGLGSILPSLTFNGEVSMNRGSFRGIPFSQAGSEVFYTNSVWSLPNLHWAGGGSEAKIGYQMNSNTGEFSWSLGGRLHPKSFGPILDKPGLKVLELFEFSEPLIVDGEGSGLLRVPGRSSARARVAASNFSFRGEACERLSASVSLDDSLLTVSNLSIIRTDGTITADEVLLNPDGKSINVKNAVSTMEADLVTRSIGSHVHELLQPYQFPTPPTVVANGRLPVGPDRVADVTFRITGSAFRYWKLNLSDYAADMYWRGQSLSVSNLNAGFYDGLLQWDGAFDFSVRDGADFQFRGTAAGSNLRWLMSDLTATNSTLEGTFSGNLAVTSANSDDWQSWNGFADVYVRDGFLWDIPIVGVFSPYFNKLVPVVSTRASAASGTFRIEKSVVQSGDFEVQSPAMRLRYRGTVDFDGAVDAFMQAEIFRDMWAVGRMVSMAFWPLTKIFEFRVTGTLNNPKTLPHFSTKFLLWPFQPLRTVKELLSPPQASPAITPLPNRRNAPSSVPSRNGNEEEGETKNPKTELREDP